jgi:hypothetical protein
MRVHAAFEVTVASSTAEATKSLSMMASCTSDGISPELPMQVMQP